MHQIYNAQTLPSKSTKGPQSWIQMIGSLEEWPVINWIDLAVMLTLWACYFFPSWLIFTSRSSQRRLKNQFGMYPQVSGNQKANFQFSAWAGQTWLALSIGGTISSLITSIAQASEQSLRKAILVSVLSIFRDWHRPWTSKMIMTWPKPQLSNSKISLNWFFWKWDRQSSLGH